MIIVLLILAGIGLFMLGARANAKANMPVRLPPPPASLGSTIDSSMYHAAKRRLNSAEPHDVPTWMASYEMEKKFFIGVMDRIEGSSIPKSYAIVSFAEPDCVTYLFGMAAILEKQAVSFEDQAYAAAVFIRDMWLELEPHDQMRFTKT